MNRVRRTREARLDYLQIFLFVGEDNLDAAKRLLRGFEDKLKLISKMPGMGPARPELGKGIRSFPVGSYVLFYRKIEDGIELLRVIHGARNLRKLFKRRRK